MGFLLKGIVTLWLPKTRDGLPPEITGTLFGPVELVCCLTIKPYVGLATEFVATSKKLFAFACTVSSLLILAYCASASFYFASTSTSDS